MERVHISFLPPSHTVVLPSTCTHSQDSVMVLCPMDGQHGRMMISGEEGGNTFTHTQGEMEAIGGAREGERKGSGGTYQSIST